MSESTKPTENSAKNGNKSKPMLGDAFIGSDLFYYEGNFASQGSTYGIATIQEFSDKYSLKEYIEENKIDDITFDISEKESGKFFIEIGSNVSGTREIAFCDNIQEAKQKYDDMVENHFYGLSKLSKPLEDYLINNEPVFVNDSESIKIIKKHIESGTLIHIVGS